MRGELGYIVKRPVITSKEVLSGQTSELFSLTVPVAAKVKLTRFGNTLREIEAWGSVVWSIKRNGIGCSPYDAIIDQLGYGALLFELDLDEFNGGDKITIEATNNYGDTVGVGLVLKYELTG